MMTMNDQHINDGKPALVAYVHGLHPQMEIAPCDLQPGARYALPPGFELHVDVAHDEWVRLFGPNETNTRVKTLIQYGGRFLIRGLDLLRGLAGLMRVGEPVWERSLEVQAEYWRALLAGAAPFTVEARPPVNRQELEQHIDTCPICQPVSTAMADASNAGANIATEAHRRDMMDRAHTDSAAAILHYNGIRNAHSLAVTNATTPARRKRSAVQPAEA